MLFYSPASEITSTDGKTTVNAHEVVLNDFLLFFCFILLITALYLQRQRLLLQMVSLTLMFVRLYKIDVFAILVFGNFINIFITFPFPAPEITTTDGKCNIYFASILVEVVLVFFVQIFLLLPLTLLKIILFFCSYFFANMVIFCFFGLSSPTQVIATI